MAEGRNPLPDAPQALGGSPVSENNRKGDGNMGQTLYYAGLFGLSFLLMLLYIVRWKKQFEVHMTAIFLLIPVVNLGYMLMYTSGDADTVTALLKIIYIGGCFLTWLITMCELQLCRINIRKSVRIGALLLSTAVYLSVLTIGYSPLFYRSMTIEQVGGAWVQQKVYGPFHTVHYLCVILYLAADTAAIIYSYRKKKQVSRRILLLLFVPALASVLSYFFNLFLQRTGYETMPLIYTLAQVVYLLIARRMAYYNVSEMVVESMVESGETGFITLDSDGRYLGSNETARSILPELNQLTVDSPVPDTEPFRNTVKRWLESYLGEKGENRFHFTVPGEPEERIYAAAVSDLYDGHRMCGYQIFLEDDTQDQKYIRLMNQYNSDLQAEVTAKTEKIVGMHNRLVLGLATMVESRDNSTGGHIRRTSEGVRILVDAIREGGELELTDSFCKNLIKAAPMHDLGKIAVDDEILRKPGRFTPEEYEKMKSHAAEGARIVHDILRDTDDEDFRRIAENVAHFHHERIDGSGYPDGLKGEQIPLEARIMAIADVYDALVSRRVYKSAFSFEKANQIILEGMGSQFDPELEKYYTAARPRLEAYYTGENA